MDIREYFQKEQKGFYKIIAKTLTAERRKQLYDAINDWHESELKLLGIAEVVGRSEQYFCSKEQIGQRCNEQCLGCFQFENKD